MKHKKLISVILLLTITSLCQAAVIFDAGIRNTAISGYSGTKLNINAGEFSYEETMAVGPNDYLGSFELTHTVFMGLDEIRWSERRDKPCDIVVKTHSLDSAVAKNGNETGSICTGSSSSEKTVKLSNSRYFIRGIAACTNDKRKSSKNRLKGIKIIAAKVSTAGAVTSLNTFEDTRRTNCAKWFAPVYCPGGQIASGVNVYHDGESFRGLGLRCRRVTTSNSPFKQ